MSRFDIGGARIGGSQISFYRAFWLFWIGSALSNGQDRPGVVRFSPCERFVRLANSWCQGHTSAGGRRASLILLPCSAGHMAIAASADLLRHHLPGPPLARAAAWLGPHLLPLLPPGPREQLAQDFADFVKPHSAPHADFSATGDDAFDDRLAFSGRRPEAQLDSGQTAW